MIHVKFDPEKCPDLLTDEEKKWFADWKIRAEQATDRVIAAWEAWRLSQKNPANLTDTQKVWLEKWRGSPDSKRLKTSRDGKFKYEWEEKIWSEMKSWLLEHVFHYKCAYCETSLEYAPRHAEHFRPKAQVKLGKRLARIRDENDQEFTHPGYFWLAYHWQNLMPSCTFCNTVNGKKDKFPVSNDYAPVMRQLTSEVLDQLEPRIIKSQNFDEIYYLQPSALDALERRLILHPCLDDPEKCLSFNEFGFAFPIGNDEEKKIGQESIETYNLNGDGLVKWRGEAQRQARSDYDLSVTYHRQLNLAARGNEKAIREAAKNDALAIYARPEQPYSAAALAGLKQYDPDVFS